MIKKIFLLALLTCYGLILYTQKNIFFKAGYNQSFLYEIGDNDYRYGPPELGSKPAYYFGLTYYKDKGKVIHWETWLNVTQKNFSMYYRSGGLGGWSGCDCDYHSSYIDLSYYPVLEFGKKLKVAGSIRPGLEILLYSHREGEYSNYLMGNTEIETEQISESYRYFLLGLNVNFNLRLVYNLNNRVGILLEGQYSQGIINNQLGAGIKLNFNNYSAGTGIALFL